MRLYKYDSEYDSEYLHMQCTAISASCSENDTVRDLYLNRHMSDCHLDVFCVCQEGEVLVKRTVVDVEEGEDVCEGECKCECVRVCENTNTE